MIKDHIDIILDKPIEWGVDDCTAWPAAWFEKQTGLTLDLEPYNTRKEAQVIIDKTGSLVNLWSNALENKAIEQYGSPEIGDVGIIETEQFGQVGGIFGEHGLFFWRTIKGVAILKPRTSTIVKIWKTC